MNSLLRPLLLGIGITLIVPGILSAAVVSGSYIGDGSNGKTITLNFKPSVVIIKGGGATPAQIRTSTMTSTTTWGQGATPTSGTDRITSLTSTGFTLGANSFVNGTGVTYYYFALDVTAGDSAVGTYAGNGTDNRNITGVGFQPDFVITMRENDSSVWRNSSMTGDNSAYWDGTAAGADHIQSFGSDGFQVGTSTRANSSGSTYHYIAAKNVTGKFKVGTYTGTGATLPISGLGFRPVAVFTKRDGSTTGGFKFASTGNTSDITLVPNSSNFATGGIISLDSNGFTLGTGGNRANGATFPYYYFAWGESLPVSNTAPTISDVANQSVSAGVATSALAITVGDAQTAVGSLTMSGSSGNTTLVPNANIVFGGSGASRTVTVTPAAGQTGTATITLTVTDGGGLTKSDTFVLTVIDITAPAAPVFTGVSTDTGSSSSDRITFDTSLTLSGTAEANSTVDITRVGTGVTKTTTANGSGNWSFEASTLAAGTYSFTATAKDAAGNTSAASAAFSVTVDLTVPDITISAPSTTTTTTGPVSFTITYNGQSSISLTAVDITANSTGSVSVSSISVSGSGSTRTVTLESITGAGTLGISIRAGTGSDTAGNQTGTVGPSATIAVGAPAPDTTPPAVSSINRQNPTAATTAATNVTYRVTFGENVTGVDAGDFALTATGSAAGTIGAVSAVSGTGNAFDVAVNFVYGAGTLRLDLKSSGTGIADSASNAIATGFTTGQTYTLDRYHTLLFGGGQTAGDYSLFAYNTTIGTVAQVADPVPNAPDVQSNQMVLFQNKLFGVFYDSGLVAKLGSFDGVDVTLHASFEVAYPSVISMRVFGNNLYLFASTTTDTPAEHRHLFRFDPTANTLTKISGSVDRVGDAPLTVFDSALYFLGRPSTDSSAPFKLYKWDGSAMTEAPGTSGAVSFSSSTRLAVFNNQIFLIAMPPKTSLGSGQVQNQDVWRYNGTTMTRAANITSDTTENRSFSEFAILGNKLFFAAAPSGILAKKIYSFDTSNTLVTEYTSSTTGNPLQAPFPAYGKLYFFEWDSNLQASGAYRLRRYDSLNSVTTMINGHFSSLTGNNLSYDNDLVFGAYDAAAGSELHRIDLEATTLPTTPLRLADLRPGRESGVGGESIIEYPGNIAPAIVRAAKTHFVLTTSGAITLTSTLQVNEVDDGFVTGATVSLSGFQTGDLLAFTAPSGITGSFDSTAGVLTLSGAASPAQYQTALRSVTFDPAATPGTRIVRFRATDGQTFGSAASAGAAVTVVVANQLETLSFATQPSGLSNGSYGTVQKLIPILSGR